MGDTLILVSVKLIVRKEINMHITYFKYMVCHNAFVHWFKGYVALSSKKKIHYMSKSGHKYTTVYDTEMHPFQNYWP